MILIDAIYINGGGGKVLLDYLITELEKTDKKIFYLLDERIKTDELKIKNTNQLIYFKSSLWDRFNFYQKNKNSFSTILCFGNLPPNIKTGAKVFTYFHQTLFLELNGNFTFIQKTLYFFKTNILNFFKKNTDFWLVQSELIKEKMSLKYSIEPPKILLLPFYPEFEVDNDNIKKIPRQYIFVSNATDNKNHQKLIEAFCTFYDLHKKGNLILTISKSYPEIFNLIEEKIKLNYPIKNIGFVNRKELQKHYLQSEFIIFPSLAESFGLGLVEAIDNKCKVIGADLPYTYAVCEPSLTFNPYEVSSIVQAFCLSLQEKLPDSKSKIKNQINDLINLLQ